MKPDALLSFFKESLILRRDDSLQFVAFINKKLYTKRKMAIRTGGETMLCQFSFRNFKSYKETTTFDFQATSIPEFSDSLLNGAKGDALLPVGVVYGPNGGGKTNLLSALSCLISTVVNPIYELEKTREKVIIQQKINAVPFAFDEVSREMPTEF